MRCSQSLTRRSRYSEVPLAGHWFNEVLSSKTVNNFLASMLVSPPQPPFPLTFTITTANPDESGSKHGFRIIELEVPGRIARIEVTIYEPVGGVAGRSRAVARTRNVRRLSLDPTVAPIALSSLSLNGEDNFEIQSSPSGSPVVYSLAIDGRFSIASDSPPARRYGPLLSILSSTKPLHIVIGTQGLPRLTLHLASIARRISHDMLVYGRVNSLIVLDRDVRLEELDEGKLVLLGDSFSNMMTRSLETSWPVPGTFRRASGSFFQDLLIASFLPQCLSFLHRLLQSTRASLRLLAKVTPLRLSSATHSLFASRSDSTSSSSQV